MLEPREFSDYQRRYLANSVFSSLRRGWRTQERLPGDLPDFRILGAGKRSSAIITAAFITCLAAGEARLNLGMHAILMDIQLYESIEYEVTAESWEAWNDALTDDCISKLWYVQAGEQTVMRRNPNAPRLAAGVSLKLVEVLALSRLIVPVNATLEQRYEEAEQKRNRSAEAVVMEALELAASA